MNLIKNTFITINAGQAKNMHSIGNRPKTTQVKPQRFLITGAETPSRTGPGAGTKSRTGDRD